VRTIQICGTFNFHKCVEINESGNLLI